MKRRFSFPEILTLIIVSLVSVVILTLLGIWSLYIKNGREEEILRRAMQSVVEERGEEALLKMAGIPTDQIYYKDGLSLFEAESPSWQYTADEARRIAVYKKCKESVVQIQLQAELSDSGQGSGVIISKDGYIVTNKHVIGSGVEFSVNFYDGSTREAKLVGYDELSDIAVIKVPFSEDLVPIALSDREALTVGEDLYAIGNPYGYTWSFTSGIVSGVDRLVSTSGGNVIPNMIQTDALINPGNSGGPLIDRKGEMVGLISSIYSTSGSAQGISFALPSDTVKDVAKQIIETGKASRGWLDIVTVELNSQIVSYSKLKISEGILISQVVPAGPADKSGLKGGNERAQYGSSVIYLGGDIITAINGNPIRNYTDYFAALFDTKAGDKVSVTVYRKDSYITIEDVALVEQTAESMRWIAR